MIAHFFHSNHRALRIAYAGFIRRCPKPRITARRCAFGHGCSSVCLHCKQPIAYVPLGLDEFSAFLRTVWWQNFTLNAGTGIANALPYIVKCSTNGLSGCMPGKTTGSTYVISSFVSNWTLGAEESLNAHKVIDYDPPVGPRGMDCSWGRQHDVPRGAWNAPI